jgi:hypothetical protein
MLTPTQHSFIRHLVIRRDDPKNTLSEEQFATYVGVHPKTLQLWKKKPEFAEALTRAFEEYDQSGDYFRTCARHQVLEQGLVEFGKAKGAERRKWWAQLVKETQDAEMASDTIDYSSLSDDELEALCLSRNTSPLAMGMAEFRELVSKQTPEMCEGEA